MVKLLFFPPPDCSETTRNALLQSRAGWFLQHQLHRLGRLPAQPLGLRQPCQGMENQGKAPPQSHSSSQQLCPHSLPLLLTAAPTSPHFPALLFSVFSFFSGGVAVAGHCALWERALAGGIHSSIPILLPQGERAGSKGGQMGSGCYFWWEETQQQFLCLDCMDTVPSRGAEPQLHHVAAATAMSHGEKLPMGWL